MTGFGLGMPLAGGLMMLGFWVPVIAGAVVLIVIVARGTQGARPTNALGIGVSASQASSDPADIVKVRYARGEITQDQYREMRRDLGLSDGPVS